MKNIKINISNKIATLKEKFVGVCGNSDYVVVFDFDDEWKSHATKTARFKHGGQYTDVVFTGNECPMPIILDASSVEIGVYAGNLHTTTFALVLMKTCILSGSGVPADPVPDVYNQIIDKINDGMLKGEDGVSPSVEVSKSGDTTTIAITDASGVHTAEIKDGSKGGKGDKGDKGDKGKDGSDATVTAQNIEAALGYVPVTPSALAAKQDALTDADRQSITKIGMTTGAAWTAAEQKAARERMGIPGDYELIEEIVLTESSIVMRANEPDGTPYKFDKLKYCVIVPAAAAAAGLYVNALIYSDTGIYAIAYTELSSNVDNVVAGEMKKEGATWECFQPVLGKIGPQAMYKTAEEHLSIPNAYGEYIAKFFINVALPTDTKIYIYGVRV